MVNEKIRGKIKALKLNTATAFIIFFAALFLFNRFIVFTVCVTSESMENTLDVGDNIMCIRSRICYALSEPKRGDIVVFKYPDDPAQKFIKRIIGLPGDEVVIDNEDVYINGVLLTEDYAIFDNTYNAAADGDSAGVSSNHFTVPDGSYFVLGDNRDHSWDSRYWDTPYVPEENILGKAICIIFPFNRIGTVQDAIIEQEEED